MIFAQGHPHGNITEPRPFSDPFENEADYAAVTRFFVKETTMLSGKVALMTGSTSGIGLGIARALAADGADILLNGFGITKVVALETVTTGITCNAICPAWVLTPLVQKQTERIAARHELAADAPRMKLLGEKQPSLDFATPEQIGAATLFLYSPAAAEIRGIALPVDGGWTAQ